MSKAGLLDDLSKARANKRKDIIDDILKKYPNLEKPEQPKEEPQEEKNVLDKIAENKKKKQKK